MINPDRSGSASPSMTSAWLDAFSASLTGVAAATVDGYVKHAEWLLRDLDDGLSPWDVTHGWLSAWLDRHNWSVTTRRKVVTSLRRFYAYGTASGLCAWSPVAGVSVSNGRKRGPQQIQLAPAWHHAVVDYLTWLRAGGRSDGTVAVRRWWLLRLAEASPSPWLVTTEQLATWLSQGDWTAETRRCARGTAQGFYRWAVKVGRAEHDPAADLDPVLVRRALPRPASTEALQLALVNADDRVGLALTIAAYAGLRRAEVASLHFRDVGPDMLTVRHGKGGHDRQIPMHPELRAALAAERHRRRAGMRGTGWPDRVDDPDGYVFPAEDPSHPLTAKHLGKLMAAALPGGSTAHSLRHRFASRAYAGTRDLRAVQELLGHSKPETTSIYAAVPDGALSAAVLAV